MTSGSNPKCPFTYAMPLSECFLKGKTVRCDMLKKKFRKTNCGKLSGEALIARWQWIYLHKAQMVGTYSDVFIAHSFTFLNCKSEDRALSYILKNSDCSNSVTVFIFMLTICMFCTIYSIMLFNRKKISKHAPNSWLKDVYIYTYRIYIHI